MPVESSAEREAPSPRMTSRVREVLSAAGRSRVTEELVWWHVALVLPTLAFHALYVYTIYGEWRWKATIGIRAWLAALGEGPWTIAVNLLFVIGIDVLEVAVLVAILYFVGRVVLRLGSASATGGGVFVGMLLIGANHFSVWQVGHLMSSDTLGIAVSWTKQDPRVLAQYLTPRVAGLLGMAVLWSWVALRLTRPLPASSRSLSLRRGAYRILLPITALGCAVGALGLLAMPVKLPPALRGYWSSTAVSLLELDRPAPLAHAVPPPATIKADYLRLVYPRGIGPAAEPLVTVPRDRLAPRHIVIISLETAALKYYPLLDNPAFPTFHAMSEQAIVSTHHYTTAPFTWSAVASIVSGTYLGLRGLPDYADVETDSLPTILARRGYDTTYIDSFLIDWASAYNRSLWKSLGFTRLLDTADDKIPFSRSSMQNVVDKERQSLGRALAAILDAESRGRKALVLDVTILGHSPWLAGPGEEGETGAEKLLGIAARLDTLLGEFLRALAEHGLRDQVLIVATGDHGLRYRGEFDSLGEQIRHSNVAFNVPFLLYAPGLLDHQVRVPYLTSHVDVEPTLLALSGIDPEPYLLHGGNMLDTRLKDRMSFMMNTGLSPVDGFHWNGCHYTVNDLTGQVETRRAASPDAAGAPGCEGIPGVLSPQATRAVLDAARASFDTTAAYFHARKVSGAR
jgi:Sulfatase